jgi:sulfur dioxygenase
MILRQLFDAASCTYTYLLGDPSTREAVLIDPVVEQVERDAQLVQELGLELRYVLETHVHADHVTAAAALRARFGAASVLGRAAGGEADVVVDDGEAVRFGNVQLEARFTPGHTTGCVTWVVADKSRAFTGDTLLIRGCGRTDFQGGSAVRMYQSVHDRIFSLPDGTLLYPAHDYKGRTVTTVLEEREWNPRLGGGKTEAEFVAIMASLQLATPRLMDVAVPANLRGGRRDEDDASQAGAAPPQLAWAPVVRTVTGVPEVDVDFVRGVREMRIVDVREPDEFTGELGRVAGAQLVPLATVVDRAAQWQKDEPIVLVCRSGGRSGRAAEELERRGFRRVASMKGGMLRWHERGFDVER